MSMEDEVTPESPLEPSSVEIGSAVVFHSRLRPNDERIFARVPMLTKVDGISEGSLEALNTWYQNEWRVVHASRFSICKESSNSLKTFFSNRPSVSITADEVLSYLGAQCLLYYGLRDDESGVSDVSKNKYFQRYYYMARENPSALNSVIVLSNFLWACHKYMRDEFANTCLLDILLQAFPVALESFVKLGGVTYLRSTIDYLAANKKLISSTNYLLKALALLNKLDISFRTLQVSRIGISINGIATAGKKAKLGIDYECGNDQVKLKATDLIKKWKAIRDASQSSSVEAHSRAKLRKQHVKQSDSSSNDIQQITTPSLPTDAPKSAPSQPSKQSMSSSGSFVLNILDSMVEQREKERKRKLAMKEAQRNSLFKVSKSMEGGSVPRHDDSATTPVRMETPTSFEEVAGQPSTSSNARQNSDQVAESRKELQSLMNFFKTFKPQSAATAAPDAQAPALPYSGAFPSPSFPSIPPSSDITGLSFPSNNITHMNPADGGPSPPVPPSPASAPPNIAFRFPPFMGGNGMNLHPLPPWK